MRVVRYPDARPALLPVVALACLATGLALEPRDWRSLLAVYLLFLIPASILSSVSRSRKTRERLEAAQPLPDDDIEVLSGVGRFRSSRHPVWMMALLVAAVVFFYASGEPLAPLLSAMAALFAADFVSTLAEERIVDRSPRPAQ